MHLLNSFLKINHPSGRLIRWSLRITEFDFEVKYIKGKANMPSDVLSILKIVSETITQNDTGEILVFLLDDTNLELQLNRSSYEVQFIDVKFNKVDELYATFDKPRPPTSNLEPIGVEDLLKVHLHDA